MVFGGTFAADIDGAGSAAGAPGGDAPGDGAELTRRMVERRRAASSPAPTTARTPSSPITSAIGPPGSPELALAGSTGEGAFDSVGAAAMADGLASGSGDGGGDDETSADGLGSVLGSPVGAPEVSGGVGVPAATVGVAPPGAIGPLGVEVVRGMGDGRGVSVGGPGVGTGVGGGVGNGVGLGVAGGGVGATTVTLPSSNTPSGGHAANEHARTKCSPGAAPDGIWKFRIAFCASAWAVPSRVMLSHQNVTGPTGKPVAVALTVAPGNPLEGATMTFGTARTGGALASTAPSDSAVATTRLPTMDVRPRKMSRCVPPFRSSIQGCWSRRARSMTESAAPSHEIGLPPAGGHAECVESRRVRASRAWWKAARTD